MSKCQGFYGPDRLRNGHWMALDQARQRILCDLDLRWITLISMHIIAPLTGTCLSNVEGGSGAQTDAKDL